MKNHGTIIIIDVFSDDEFPGAVKQVWQEAATRFGYGAPREDFFEVDVRFLACSRWGDVYVVHVTDKLRAETATGRLTQQNVRHDDAFRTLSSPV